MALSHPVAADLREAGVIDSEGSVDPVVREWLAVLSRRDIAVLLHIRTPGQPDPERVLLARFAQWWAALERSGNRVRLSPAGTTTSERSAGILINSQVDRLCGQSTAAPLKPVTLDVAELVATVRDPATLRAHLIHLGLDGDQAAVLMLAADRERSAQASVVAIQSGVPGGPARSHIQPAAVTIIDTPRGRLVCEHVPRGGKAWMIVSPGSPSNVASATLALMRNLPASELWHAYRKVV